MSINHVVYDGQVLIDLTEDTITPEALLAGHTAHDKSGQKITGTLEVPKFLPLTFIQSSGTQYIDTDFVPNQDTRIDIVIQLSDNESATVAGVDESWITNAFAIFSNVAEYGSGSLAGTFYGSSIVTVSLNKNKLYKNGTLLSTGTYKQFNAPCSLTLFALNRNGDVREYSSMNLYQCQIYDNGELVRDFSPVMLLTGEVGLWDSVNNKFYGNAGTGTFGGGVGDITSTLDYTQEDSMAL